MLSTLNVVQQIPQETKHRDNISDDSHSTSNNSSQAWRLISQTNLWTVRDTLFRVQSNVSHPSVTLLYLLWSLACKIHNFANGCGTFSNISLPIGPRDSEVKFSRIFIFWQKCHQISPKSSRHQVYRGAVNHEFHVKI